MSELKKISRGMIDGLRDYSIDEYMANFSDATVIETKALIVMNPDGEYDCLIVDEFGDLVRSEAIVRENKNRIWGIENKDFLLSQFD